MAGERLIVEAAEFATKAAQWIEWQIAVVLESAQYCHMMLAGGGTPLPVYAELARSATIPWQRMALYFGDERCVPPDHAASNYRAVVQHLFPDGLPEGVMIHRMRGEIDPQQAALEYQALLPQRIDILLLGIGDDGHTASLFPGSPALKESSSLVAPVIGSKPPPKRLTITPLVISSARSILLLALGEGKTEAVNKALRSGDLPASLASRGDWIMDRAAAEKLYNHAQTGRR